MSKKTEGEILNLFHGRQLMREGPAITVRADDLIALYRCKEACDAVMEAMNIPGPPLPIDTMLQLKTAIDKAPT